jgi:hypothetical protein
MNPTQENPSQENEACSACSVHLLDWTCDKLSELIQDQANIHPAQMLCERAA